MAQLLHDTPAAVRFLRGMHTDRALHLVAIHANGRVEAITFEADAHESAFHWLDARQGVANLYFQVNESLPGVRNKKAKKQDIATARHLHVDIDDPEALPRIQAYEPAPSVVLFSGGGFQAFWTLSEPTTDLEGVELRNAKIAQDLGGDNCHNIDRIMRVPGTINIPNAKKRSQGRVEALAYVVERHGNFDLRYSAHDFQPLVAAEPATEVHLSTIPAHIELDTLPDSVSEETRQLIIHGDDPSSPMGEAGARYPSRSEIVFRVICDLLRANVAHDVIASLLLDQAYGISQSVLDKKQPERYALKQIRAALEAVAGGWPDATSKGPRPTYRNTVIALDRLGLEGQHDVFHHRKLISGDALQGYAGELSDDLCAVIRSAIIDQFGFDPGKYNVIEAANVICLENKVHPVSDYLNLLRWDGQERVPSLLNHYFGAEDTPLHRAMSRAVMVAAVRRVRQAGSKFDTVLVLEGKQGSGKSTAIRILAGDSNFADQDILSVDAKQQIELIEGVWLFELGELSGMNKADIARLKAFVSRQVDRGRPAYGRYREDRPRQVVFIGTTNQGAYLRDTTGNRRFWPVATTTIDTDALARDRDQLWAEAAHLEEQGFSVVLPEELWADAAAAQTARLEEHPWHDILSNAEGSVANGLERITTEEIFSDLLHLPPGSRQPFQQQQIGSIMISLGWSGPKRIRVGGKVLRGYERPSREPNREQRARQKF